MDWFEVAALELLLSHQCFEYVDINRCITLSITPVF